MFTFDRDGRHIEITIDSGLETNNPFIINRYECKNEDLALLLKNHLDLQLEKYIKIIEERASRGFSEEQNPFDMSNDGYYMFSFGRSGDCVEIVINTGLKTKDSQIIILYECKDENHAVLLSEHLKSRLEEFIEEISRKISSRLSNSENPFADN